MPLKIACRSRYGNMLYMMTSCRWLIQIKEENSTKFKRYFTEVARKLTGSPWSSYFAEIYSLPGLKFLITCRLSVRLSVSFSHFLKFLLQNHWTNFSETWYKSILDEGNSSYSDDGPGPFYRIMRCQPCNKIFSITL